MKDGLLNARVNCGNRRNGIKIGGVRFDNTEEDSEL